MFFTQSELLLLELIEAQLKRFNYISDHNVHYYATHGQIKLASNIQSYKLLKFLKWET